VRQELFANSFEALWGDLQLRDIVVLATSLVLLLVSLIPLFLLPADYVLVISGYEFYRLLLNFLIHLGVAPLFFVVQKLQRLLVLFVFFFGF
jgi:hypothetical protein